VTKSRFTLLSISLIVALLVGLIGSAFAAAGDLDLTFNGTGFVRPVTTTKEELMAVTQQADSKLVAAGYVTIAAADTDFVLKRYLSNSSPDLPFGASGKVTTSFGADRDVANAIALQADVLTTTQDLGGVIRENLPISATFYDWDLSYLARGIYHIYARVSDAVGVSATMTSTITDTRLMDKSNKHRTNSRVAIAFQK
jgi:hypothetical protein